jgi:hypothetical protein
VVSVQAIVSSIELRNPTESQPIEITHLLFQSASKTSFGKLGYCLAETGPQDQAVFVNPEHVRVVRADYPHSDTIILLDRQQISVREDVDKVIKALS